MKKSLAHRSVSIYGPTVDIAIAQTNSLKDFRDRAASSFPKIVPVTLVISADGKRLVYTIGEGAYDPEMGLSEGWPKHRLIVDGKAGKAYPRIFDLHQC